jgi:hypothetical protein
VLFEKGIHKVIIFEGQKSCYYEKVIFISICCGHWFAFSNLLKEGECCSKKQ